MSMLICDMHCDTLYMRLQPDHTPCVTMEAMKKRRYELADLYAFRSPAGRFGVSS